MRSLTRTLVVTMALLFCPAPSLLAQTAVNPSGHWDGTVNVPNMPVKVGFDVAKNSKGEWAGTFDQPGQSLKGLPLSSVTVEGKAITLLLKAGAGASTFTGTLSDDGTTLSGTWSQNDQSFPFAVTRTGDAIFTPLPKSPAIGKELVGTWTGMLESGARQMHIVLTMANQPDGTATGTIASPEGSGIEIAIAMTQKGSNLAVTVPTVGASFAGTLNADGTELAGTWTQGASSLPVTFKKAIR